MRQLNYVDLIKLTEYHPKVDTWKFILSYA